VADVITVSANFNTIRTDTLVGKRSWLIYIHELQHMLNYSSDFYVSLSYLASNSSLFKWCFVHSCVMLNGGGGGSGGGRGGEFWSNQWSFILVRNWKLCSWRNEGRLNSRNAFCHLSSSTLSTNLKIEIYKTKFYLFCMSMNFCLSP
jgi:hypothetical protein